MRQQEQLLAQSMKAGFTLVELLVVVAILGILGTIAVQNVTGHIAKARITAAEQGVAAIKEACATYYLQNKKMPDNVDALCEGDEPILDSDKYIYDPWDNKYEIEKKGKNRIVVISYGEDGQKGTEDDVRSDDKKKKD